jgi:VWFA-related protein
MAVHTMPRLFLAPILITSLFVSAQEPPPTGRVFTDSVRVDVVNVEVFVVDKKGQPVYGLQREDFELLVNGEPVEISNFYAPPAPEETPAEPGPIALEAVEVAPPPRHIVIFVDHTNLAKARRPEVMAALRTLVEERLAAGDRIMIADYEAGVKVLSNFGDPPEAHAAALQQIDRTGAATFTTQSEFNRILRCIEVNCNEPDMILGDIDFFARNLRHRTRMMLGHLGTIIEAMAGLPGRRSMLIVSDGFPVRPGEALYAVWQSRYTGQDGGFQYQFQAGRFAITSDVEEITDLANARRVTLYLLNNGGVVGNPLAMSSAATSATNMISIEAAFVHDTNYSASMQALTNDTGGRIVYKPTEETLDDVRRDFDTAYSLGFTPDHEPDDRPRNIKVRVRPEGLKVRYRDNYTLTTDEGSAAIRTKMAAILGEGSNPLGISVDFEPEAGRARKRRIVQTAIRIPVGNLAMVPVGNDVYQGRLEFTFYLEDEEGATTPIQQTTLPLELPGEAVASETPIHITYDVGFKVRAGNHRLALSVTDSLGSTTSTLTWDLAVDNQGHVTVADR